MAIYGFNEKLEKVKFICIDETITTSSFGVKYWNAATLASDYGVTDITKLRLVGFSFDSNINDRDSYYTVFNVYTNTETGGTPIGKIFPFVEIQPDSQGGVYFVSNYNEHGYKVFILLIELP